VIEGNCNPDESYGANIAELYWKSLITKTHVFEGEKFVPRLKE
jgi:hypothetical protein